MKRWAALAALVALLVAGCAGAEGREPGAGEQPGAGAGELPGAGAGPSGAEAVRRPGDAIGPSGADQGGQPSGEAGLVQVHLEPGAVVDQPGIYFMQVRTGQIEGWVTADGLWASFDVSPDNRWVTARWQEAVHLVDRETGAQFRWAPDEHRLVAAQGSRLLFADERRLWLTDERLQPIAQIDVAPREPRATFSPDGDALLLVSGDRIYLVAAESGDAREIGQLPAHVTGDRSTGIDVIAARPRPGEPEVQVIATFAGEQGTGGIGRALLRRYSWQGDLIAEVPLPREFWLSPDGRLVAYESTVGPFFAVEIAELDGLKPVLRVKSARLCDEDLRSTGGRWLADSSRLVVRTASGYRMVNLQGHIEQAEVFRHLDWMEEPIPSPHDPRLFAIGRRTAVTIGGRELSAASLKPEWAAGPLGHLDPWGERADEIRFTVPHGGHHPRCATVHLLPPKAEFPPYADAMALAVDLPPGDCLNLREEPGLSGRVITCLPGGTRVQVVPDGRKPPLGFDGDAFTDGYYWLRVRTGDGREGYVAASEGSLAWSFPEGVTPPPGMLDLSGEAEMMYRFLTGILEGPPTCAGCIQDTQIASVIPTMAMRCEKVDPWAQKGHPGYDPAVHGPAVNAYAAACQMVQEGMERLGDPAETPEWLELVEQAREVLEPVLPDASQ